jgi:ABC-type molybdate transport system ATPase subunit
MLALDVRRKRGAFALDIRLDVEPGRVTVLVGESGSSPGSMRPTPAPSRSTARRGSTRPGA